MHSILKELRKLYIHPITYRIDGWMDGWMTGKYIERAIRQNVKNWQI